MDNNGEAKQGAQWERIVAVSAAVCVFGLIAWVVIRNEPFADDNIVLLLRIIVSVAAAVLGATIPGFLEVEWRGGGFVIRAMGAMGLFIVTFFGSPYVIQQAQPHVEIDRPMGEPSGDLLELNVPFRAKNLQDSMELLVEVRDAADNSVLRSFLISSDNWRVPMVSLVVPGAAQKEVDVQMFVKDGDGRIVARSAARKFRY
jgi:hypothetical protein